MPLFDLEPEPGARTTHYYGSGSDQIAAPYGFSSCSTALPALVRLCPCPCPFVSLSLSVSVLVRLCPRPFPCVNFALRISTDFFGD
jgi:hypothetical protein